MKNQKENPDLLPCPFCGHDMNRQLAWYPEDTIYPVTKDYSVWNLICSALDGGCDAEILGRSREECFEKWNRRTK